MEPICATTYIEDGQGKTLATFPGHWLTPVGEIISLVPTGTGHNFEDRDLVVVSVHTHMYQRGATPVVDLVMRTGPGPVER